MHECTLNKDLRDAIKQKSEIWRIGHFKKNARYISAEFSLGPINHQPRTEKTTAEV